MKKIFLEEFINNFKLDANMQLDVLNKENFNNEMTLFDYQIDALDQLSKLIGVLKSVDFDFEEYKKLISEIIESANIDIGDLNVKKESTRKSIERFQLLESFFETNEDGVLEADNFLNRAAFWMATGSGKSLIIIKSIEYFNNLMEDGKLPKKDMLLLLPNENIISQFKELINNYNTSAKNSINLVKLDRYSERKRELTLLNEIDVYYYRSDLLRDMTSDSIIDFKDYENDGHWYIFLDEAHKGETGNSKIQDYISIMSRNGFLFNFSATFTDEIDYITTLYNFNLEKFITSGYGKNIFLPPSSFRFRKSKDELDDREKMLQVMKSILSLTLVKMQHSQSLYHNPLMVVLVNSINTQISDLLMFFDEIEKIAVGSVDDQLFNEAKDELSQDFKKGGYIFNCNDFNNHDSFYTRNDIINISKNDILKCVFNSESHGQIELLDGETGKEIALKLTTSDRPFGLIKIGDADRFKREKLGPNYISYKSVAQNQFFKDINDEGSPFNILFGSRSFYEGWDSNRPNVMNFINIGGSEAKKFVLQALGRGVRIEPLKGQRKRLSAASSMKNIMLETLFIFATDHQGIKIVLDTLNDESHADRRIISDLITESDRFIKLLIPKYKTIKNINAKSKFAISSHSLSRSKQYFSEISEHTFIVRYGATITEYKYLASAFSDQAFFMIDESKDYQDMSRLMQELLAFIRNEKDVFYRINELKDEIVHFKDVTTTDLSENIFNELCEKIDKAKTLTEAKKKDLKLKLINDDISTDEFTSATKLKVGNYELLNIKNHLYLPIILSHDESQTYINHIVNQKSEVDFLKSLNDWLEKNSKDIKSNWMFSIVIENTDALYIPYFDPSANKHRKFYPDFVFWIQEEDKYRIVFVDLKGRSFSNYIFKIEGYKELFLENEGVKQFQFEEQTVEVEVKMVTDNLNKIPSEYQTFWIEKDNFKFLE